MPPTLPSPHPIPPRPSSSTFSFTLPSPSHHPALSTSPNPHDDAHVLSLPPSPALPSPSPTPSHPHPSSPSHSSPPHPHPSHAEAAVLDTLFSLLLNLSIVALIAGIVLVVGVVVLPARSDVVSRYNARVEEWEGWARGQFEGVVWRVGDGDVMQARVGGVDELNDVGDDLLSYSPLLYSFNASIIRPSGRFTGHPQGVTEAAPLSLSATPLTGAFNVSSAFNITLALIKKVNRAVTQHLCTLYSGVWRAAERSCDYYVGLTQVCVTVLLDKRTASWQLFDASEPDGVYRPKATNATHEQAMVEEGRFGCAYDATKDEGKGGWDVGSYEPLNEDPYSTSTKTTMSVASTWGEERSGGTQRRLLSTDDDDPSSTGPCLASSPPTSSPSTSASATSSRASSSSSSAATAVPTSSPVALPPRTLQPILLVRHYTDPFLYAQDLTHNTLWFGLARHSIFILSLLCFALAAALMMGKAGTRVELWFGVERVREWLEGKKRQWEERPRMTVGGGLSELTKKGRRRRKGYTNVGSEDAASGFDEGEEEEEEGDVTLEMKEEGEREDEVKMRGNDEVGRDDEEPARYEIGDLEEAEEEAEEEEEEETRQRQAEEQAVNGRGGEWDRGEEKRAGGGVVIQPVMQPDEVAVELVETG